MSSEKTPKRHADDKRMWRTLWEGLRRHWRISAFAAGSLVAVVVLSWLKARFGESTEGDLRAVRAALLDAGLAVFGAFLVALIVGFLIDRAARERLAERLAESWLWGLLGRDAPPQIQQRAKEILEERVILSMAQIHVWFEWVDDAPEKVLRLTVRSLQTGTNYGPEPFRLQPSTSLIPSAAGFRSKVTRWEFEVYPDDPSTQGQHTVFLGDEIARLGTLDGDAVVASLSGSDLEVPEQIEARRGDKFRLFRIAEVYLRESDTFPVSIGRPALDFSMTLAGPALADLRVDVLSSRRQKVEPVRVSEPRPELRYEGGPALGVEWMWACWSLESEREFPGLTKLDDTLNSDEDHEETPEIGHET
jgi:hypothetical protein